MSIPEPSGNPNTFLGQLSNINKRFPSTLYIAKWLVICSITGALIGSASAFFLVSLDWATQIREANDWLIWLLPVAGFAIGLLYHYFGKGSRAGE